MQMPRISLGGEHSGPLYLLSILALSAQLIGTLVSSGAEPLGLLGALTALVAFHILLLSEGGPVMSRIGLAAIALNVFHLMLELSSWQAILNPLALVVPPGAFLEVYLLAAAVLLGNIVFDHASAMAKISIVLGASGIVAAGLANYDYWLSNNVAAPAVLSLVLLASAFVLRLVPSIAPPKDVDA